MWIPILNNWFTEGEVDPRTIVIQVEVQEGYYWENKHGNTVAFATILTGAVLGKTLDDSTEGKLNV